MGVPNEYGGTGPDWDKRAQNREYSTEHLRKQGVEFTSHNNGAHLVVISGRQAIDFWPGTGKFITRSTGRKGRGVFNLLKEIGR